MKDETREICEGCLTGNPYKCKSFNGNAPKHAKRHDEYTKNRAKQQSKEKRKEEEETLRALNVFRMKPGTA